MNLDYIRLIHMARYNSGMRSNKQIGWNAAADSKKLLIAFDEMKPDDDQPTCEQEVIAWFTRYPGEIEIDDIDIERVSKLRLSPLNLVETAISITTKIMKFVNIAKPRLHLQCAT